MHERKSLELKEVHPFENILKNQSHPKFEESFAYLSSKNEKLKPSNVDRNVLKEKSHYFASKLNIKDS